MREVLDRVGETILAADEIAGVVRRLGEELTREYQGRTPVLVVPLEGSLIFLADLLRCLNLPVEFTTCQVASYGSGCKPGSLRIIKGIDMPLAGRDVILVDDIYDSGRTLSFLYQLIADQRPGSLAVCVLLAKDRAREVEVPVDYIGVTIPDKFVVGYGMDYAQQLRHLPYIATFDCSRENIGAGLALPEG